MKFRLEIHNKTLTLYDIRDGFTTTVLLTLILRIKESFKLPYLKKLKYSGKSAPHSMYEWNYNADAQLWNVFVKNVTMKLVSTVDSVKCKKLLEIFDEF